LNLAKPKIVDPPQLPVFFFSRPGQIAASFLAPLLLPPPGFSRAILLGAPAAADASLLARSRRRLPRCVPLIPRIPVSIQ